MINIETVNEITLDGEVWKQIPNYPNYLISNLGRVYSGYKDRIDNGTKNKKGYRLIELTENKKSKVFRFSHLVAMVFCKGYAADTEIEVHHINRKRDDDRAVNLYPCTKEQHRAIHVIYTHLANNADILAELLRPLNITVTFNNSEGGDAA